MIRHVVFVAIGGSLGCVARYLVVTGLAALWPASMPIGTLVVNVVGSFILGLTAALGYRYEWLTPEWRAFLAAGFCGGFTTFSAFALENVQLLTDKSFATFGAYTLLSVALSIGGAYIGLLLGRM